MAEQEVAQVMMSGALGGRALVVDEDGGEALQHAREAVPDVIVLASAGFVAAARPDTAEHHIECLVRQLEVQARRAAQLERCAAMRGDALGVITALANEPARGGDLAEALRAALASTVGLLRVDGGALYLCERGPLQHLASCGRFVALDDPALCDLISRMEDRSAGRLEAGATTIDGRSLMASPLVAHDDLLGVVVLACPHGRALDREQRDVLEAIGAQIAHRVAVHRPLAIAIEQDATERRRLERHLGQMEKLEALGHLTAGIAQDLNSELSVILTSAQYLNESLGPRDPRSLEVVTIQNAGEQAESLTRRLLALSRRRISDASNIDLNAVVCGFEPTMRRQLGGEAKLVITLGDKLGTVRANAAQMEQCLLNLVLNARDAMPGGGTVRIRTANLARFAEQPELPAGEYVVLSVGDTGRGMDAETRRRALEPFFTTKEPGRGTGLGLSTCHEIASQSGGHIAIESEPGHGTVISMYLPRSDTRSRLSSEWCDDNPSEARGLW